MADLNRKTTLIKLIALILSIVCYALLIDAHDDYVVATGFPLVCAIYSGFMIVYIVFAIGVFGGREVDRDLNAVWSLYASSAYFACGCMLVVGFHERERKTGLMSGVVALAMGAVALADCIFTLE